jgi:hypothetical protein
VAERHRRSPLRTSTTPAQASSVSGTSSPTVFVCNPAMVSLAGTLVTSILAA